MLCCKCNEVLALNNKRPPLVESIENIQHVPDTMNFKVLINYKINTLTKANAWDSKVHPFSVTWSFWKLTPKTFSLLYCKWLIISELEKSKKVKFWMLLNYKSLVKWHGTSSHLFTKLNRILFLSTSRISSSGIQFQTNWTLSCRNLTMVHI